ncbi:MAG: glycosyltransferase family 1 protein [Verrucomicrobiota bacterium]|nr:glycosyltransferase family 1 protein [Verrucomicrobiota bacterium]
MKIAIDCRWIFREISGIGAYTVALADQLAALDRRNEYELLFDDRAVLERTMAGTRLRAAPNFRPRLVSWSVFSLRGQMAMPGLLRRERFDLFHSTNYMIPLFAFPVGRPGRARCVVTIHDVIPLAFPHYAPCSRKNRLFPIFRWIMRQVGRRADTILTVSQASRRDILAHLRIPQESTHKVRVVYNGVSDLFRPAPEKRRPAAAADSSSPRTVLYVGRQDPYKNLAGLVRALAILRRRAPFPARLAVVGAPDPRYTEPCRLADALGLTDAVAWTGYLQPDRLVLAYQQADVLAHPSRYEGFGLPVLEAMACGLPVVSSNAASLPEVAGDAALLVAPDDIEELAARLLDVLIQPALAASLAEKGIRRAAEFTWTRAAAQTLAIYEEGNCAASGATPGSLG